MMDATVEVTIEPHREKMEIQPKKLGAKEGEP
jgi:hypothetical protein